MRKYFILLLFLLTTGFLFLPGAESFAQTRAQKPIKILNFTWFNEKPTIELSYGIGAVDMSGYNTDFTKPGMIELRLGFSKEYDSRYSKKLIDFDNDFVFVSNATTDLSQKKSGGVASSMWRFGFGNKVGMGLKFGNFSVLPYSANSFAWSRFSYDKAATGSSIEYDKFDDFKDAFRFGTATEAGINLQITKGLSLQPKYEISDIYPRHLFGQQLVSSLLEYGGAELLDNFVSRVMRNSPVAGTIVNFVLKNGYEYGIYQLRKSSANWPFTGEAPLRYDTFKMGMMFTF